MALSAIVWDVRDNKTKRSVRLRSGQVQQPARDLDNRPAPEAAVRTLAMKMNHQIKYMVCVGVPSILAIVIGLCFPHRINEKVAVFCFGGPAFIYVTLARFFHAGELFNCVLFSTVITGYLAAFLAPLYYIFRSFKWSLVFVQIGLGIVHFRIGLVLVI